MCREGPGSQPLQRMGLLKHVPYALCDGARLATEGVPTAGSGSSKEYPHVHDIARTIAHDVNELIMGIISVRPAPLHPPTPTTSHPAKALALPLCRRPTQTPAPRACPRLGRVMNGV